jgi:hypothetical protein
MANKGNTNILAIPTNSSLATVISDLDTTFSTDVDVNVLQSAATLTSSSIEQAWTKLVPKYTITGSCANDAAAASAGVPVGGMYHTSGVVKVRLV